MYVMQNIIAHLSAVETRARFRPYTTVEDYTHALDDACLLICRMTAYSIRADVSSSSPVRCLRRAKNIGDLEVTVRLDLASHIHTSFTVRLIQDTMVLTRVTMSTVSGKIEIHPTHIAGPSMTSLVPITSDDVTMKTSGQTRCLDDVFQSFVKDMFRLDLVPLNVEDDDDDVSDDDTDTYDSVETRDSDTEIESVSWNEEDTTDDDSSEYQTPPPSPPKKKIRTIPRRYIVGYGFM